MMFYLVPVYVSEKCNHKLVKFKTLDRLFYCYLLDVNQSSKVRKNYLKIQPQIFVVHYNNRGLCKIGYPDTAPPTPCK